MNSEFQTLRDRFVESEGLPFADLLDSEQVTAVLQECGIKFRKRIFDPVTTLWAFVSQCCDQDHGTNAAVSRVLAHRLATGEKACSASNSAYCQARCRLPLEFVKSLAKSAASSLEAAANEEWLWKGRHILIADGSTIIMPDTDDNQEAFPQPSSQKVGLGFPMMRIGAVFSLATGAVLDVACARYAGKKQGESTLLRKMIPGLPEKSVMVLDKYYDSFWTVAYLQERGIDCVFQKKGVLTRQRGPGKKIRGKTLGDGDTLFVWTKPSKPEWMTDAEYDRFPSRIKMRIVVFHIIDRNGKPKLMSVVTTLTDHKAYSKDDLANLYQERWNCELDLRSLKSVMQMDMLRCKTPEMVVKELWAHILAYNLLRTVMAESANQTDVQPRSISFKGTMQLVSAMEEKLAGIVPERRESVFDELMIAIASRKVGNRPGRWEPRAVKRRPKFNRILTVPRQILKARREVAME